METKLLRSARLCRCDHYAKPLRVKRSVEYNWDLARKINALGLSGDAMVDLVLTELSDHHDGRLFDPAGKLVDLDSDKPADRARWDSLFSADGRRTVNRYKARADSGAFTNRLQGRLIDTVMMMAFAMAIRECRHVGKCAGA